MITNLKFYGKKIVFLAASIFLIIACEEEAVSTRDTEPLGNQKEAVSTRDTEPSSNQNEIDINDTKDEENSIFTETNFSADALELLELVNKERKSRQLSPLTLNIELINAAVEHSMDMKDNIGGLNHIGSDGSSFSERARRADYKGFPRAENIAVGQRSPQEVFNSWMNSPGHRQNILLPDTTEMGLGRSGNFWTQVFGRG